MDDFSGLPQPGPLVIGRLIGRSGDVRDWSVMRCQAHDVSVNKAQHGVFRATNPRRALGYGFQYGF